MNRNMAPDHTPHKNSHILVPARPTDPSVRLSARPFDVLSVSHLQETHGHTFARHNGSSARPETWNILYSWFYGIVC
jgi:hypothetical protein